MTAKQYIDFLRLERGWTLNQLANELEISNSTVYSWYRKKGFNPSIKSIERACEKFHMTATEFYANMNADNQDNSDRKAKEALLLNSFRRVPEEDLDKVLKIVKTFEKQ